MSNRLASKGITTPYEDVMDMMSRDEDELTVVCNYAELGAIMREYADVDALQRHYAALRTALSPHRELFILMGHFVAFEDMMNQYTLLVDTLGDRKDELTTMRNNLS